MKIYILVDDSKSWIVPYARILSNTLIKYKHSAHLVFNQIDICQCDIAFYLGCTTLVKKNIMNLGRSNVVVHPSSLPAGRGFSPLAWQILEGKNIVTITLFEATESVDEGDIYLSDQIKLNGTELNDEIKEKQGGKTIDLCFKYVELFGTHVPNKQIGEATYYKSRGPLDSQLDPHKTIAEQFNLLRIVDNKRYPAFFNYSGCDYIIEIKKKKC
jgi:methionyl-tRNA formyltransferase